MGASDLKRVEVIKLGWTDDVLIYPPSEKTAHRQGATEGF